MILKLGKWMPDSQSLGSDGLYRCINLVPVAGGYRTMLGLKLANSAAIVSTDPISGAISVESGASLVDYIADDTDLFSLTWASPTLTVTNVSKSAGAYTLSGGNLWDFTQYGGFVIACNGGAALSDPMQVIAIGGANFADLGGSPPKAKSVTTIGEFVVVGHTYDATDGEVSNRVRWSGYGDHTSWAVSPATQSDFQDLNTTDGDIQRVCGGSKEGFVVTENATYLMIYEGPPTVFRFDKIADVGTHHAHSVLRIGDYVYMYNRNGPVRVGVDGSEKWLARGQCEEYMRRKIYDAGATNVIGYHDAHENAYGLMVDGEIQGYQYYIDWDQWCEIIYQENVGGPDPGPEGYIWKSKIFTINGVQVETVAFKNPSGLGGGSDDKIYFRGDDTNSEFSGAVTHAVEINPGRRTIVQRVRHNQNVWGDINATPTPQTIIGALGFNNMGQLDFEDDLIPRSEVGGTFTQLTVDNTNNNHMGFIEGRYHLFDIYSETSGTEDRAAISEIEILEATPGGRF